MLASRAKILSLIPTICVYCNTIFMYSAANRVPSTNQVDPQENNREKKYRMPDISFHTKGMVVRELENKVDELNMVHQKSEGRLNELLELRSQRTKDLQEINRQKDLIIELYSRLNSDSSESPLRITG
jgi:hypothetical protein